MIAPRPADQELYQQQLAPWLPPRLFDCHVHVSLPQHWGPLSEARRQSIWALEVGLPQSWPQLRQRLRLLFPGREVSVLAFGGVYREVDLAANNAYVLAGARRPAHRAHALLVTHPDWDPDRIREGLAQGFVGIKPYPDLAPAGMEGARLHDFLPPAHLAALDEAGGVLMLHLPRPGRLGDADNIRDLLELADRYPAIKLIVAHLGRAFCLPTAQRGLPHFADCPQVHFDLAAHLNADVFCYALETVGPQRLLFGSDLPVTLMRGVREHRGEQYFNYTDQPYSWNVTRKSPDQEARYTYFLYEELRALVQAVQRTGLGRQAMAQIMYANCARLLGPVG